MLIRQQQDWDRKNLQTLAYQIAPVLIAPLQCKQHAIHAVRSGELYCFIYYAKAVCVVSDPVRGGSKYRLISRAPALCRRLA